MTENFYKYCKWTSNVEYEFSFLKLTTLMKLDKNDPVYLGIFITGDLLWFMKLLGKPLQQM